MFDWFPLSISHLCVCVCVCWCVCLCVCVCVCVCVFVCRVVRPCLLHRWVTGWSSLPPPSGVPGLSGVVCPLPVQEEEGWTGLLPTEAEVCSRGQLVKDWLMEEGDCANHVQRLVSAL